MTAIYVSGPMTGLPNNNHAAFNTASKDLRALGFEVINPAEQIECDSWLEYMRLDLIALIKHADALVYLPGWENSAGAGIEIYVANSLSMPVVANDDALAVLNLLHHKAVPPRRALETTAVALLNVPMRDDQKDRA